LICACNNVGARRITSAISDGAGDLQAVGEATAAGTGCGSCRPEILRMLRDASKREAVHAA
jgi:NAD(P)H-nitrite reductase large subunit